jgi:hypothetical protein
MVTSVIISAYLLSKFLDNIGQCGTQKLELGNFTLRVIIIHSLNLRLTAKMFKKLSAL